MSLRVPFDIGDAIREGNHASSGFDAFTNTAGVPTNPTAVTLRVEKPDGTITTYSWPTGTPVLVNEAAGRFYADVDLDQAGIWSYELKGTGGIKSMAPWQDFVHTSLVG